MAIGTTTALIAGSVLGAASSASAASKSAKATTGAANTATNAELAMYNTTRADTAPQRELGYNAISLLNRLYGYGPNAAGGAGSVNGYYTGPNNSPGKTTSFSDPLGLNWPGMAQFSSLQNKLDPLSNAVFGGRKDPRYTFNNGVVTVDGAAGKAYGGQINLNDGTVTVYTPGTATRDEALSQQATDALRSGGSVSGDLWGRFGDALNNIASNGYRYTDAATQAASGQYGTPGQPDMTAFTQSPDYQFNLAEGQKAIDRSAAARSGLLSGRAIKEGERYASGLASREYSAFVDRLMQQAGLGSTGIGIATAAGQSAAGNISAIAQNAGNARGSAYAAGAQGVNNAIQGGLSNYMLQQYLAGSGGGSVAGYNPWKPYAPGATTPGPWAPGG